MESLIQIEKEIGKEAYKTIGHTFGIGADGRVCKTKIVESDGKVYFDKEGRKIFVDNDAEYYKQNHLVYQYKRNLKEGEFYADVYPKILKGLDYPCVAITQRCNMKCPICFMQKVDNLGDMTTEEFETCLKNLNPKYRYAILTGGEPALHPKLFEFLELLKKYKTNFILLTNGIKFADYKFCMKIKEYVTYPNMIGIGFDGWNEWIYENRRGFSGSLQERLKALQNLKELGISTVLFVCVDEDNIDELKNIISFAALRENHFIRKVWMTSKYPDSKLTESDIAKRVCKDFEIPREYYYEMNKLSRNMKEVFSRFGVYSTYGGKLIFKILNPTIDVFKDTKELKKINKKLEATLKDKSPAFYLKMLQFIPQAIEYAKIKIDNLLGRRKYLGICVSRISDRDTYDLFGGAQTIDRKLIQYTQKKLRDPRVIMGVAMIIPALFAGNE